MTYPEDVVKLVRDIQDPLQNLIKEIPKKSDLVEEFGFSELTEDEKKAYEEPIKDLYAQNMKLFAVKRQGVKHNVVKLYGIIWGNCSHSLQTELASIEGYEDKHKSFNSLWLMKNLKLLGAGIDKKQDIFLAYTAQRDPFIHYVRDRTKL